MKEIIKKILKNSALGRIIYEPLHKLYRLYSVPRRRRILRKNGVAVLKHLADVFSRRGIPAYATYGTLLGFVRDHGFISHDDDIDIGISPGAWTPSNLLRVLVEEEGFSFMMAIGYEGKVTEFKLSFMEVPVDFFFYEDDGKNYLSHLYYYFPNCNYPDERYNSAKLNYEPRVTSIEKIHVFDLDFPVPKNYHDVLVSLYGKTWNIPNPQWDDSMHPALADLPDYGCSMSYEDVLPGISD